MLQRVVCLAMMMTSVLAGCGESVAPPVPASGVVVNGGEPVAGASVTFIPDGGRSANGVTDSEGRFTLTTYQPNDGAIAGEHTVVVTTAGGDVPETIPVDYDYSAEQESDPAIPPKFADPNQSGLKVVIPDGGTSEIVIDLAN